MPEALEDQIEAPVLFGEQINRAYPGLTELAVEVLSREKVWGYAVASDGMLKPFVADYGASGMWTVTPVYAV